MKTGSLSTRLDPYRAHAIARRIVRFTTGRNELRCTVSHGAPNTITVGTHTFYLQPTGVTAAHLAAHLAHALQSNVLNARQRRERYVAEMLKQPVARPPAVDELKLRKRIENAIVKRGYLVPKPTRVEKVVTTAMKQADKLESIQRRINTWSTKLRRAEKALAKLVKQARYYEKVLGQRSN